MSDMRRALVAGNWKMNGDAAMATTLSQGVVNGTRGIACDVLLCPPTPYLSLVAGVLSGSDVLLGAQDCHAAQNGAHTGDVSAEMLADCGCRYVIVGHSERRADHGEDDAMVMDKAAAAHRAGLVAIVCVGETEAERDAGQAEAVVASQLSGSMPADVSAADTVVAYEPVWAIGTGRTPTAADVQAMHRHMRRHIAEIRGADFADRVRLLYGGSVKPGNATELMGLPDVDGGLIGGASLAAEDFVAIAESTGQSANK